MEYENCYRALEQISRQMDVLCVRWVESYTQLLEKARAVFVEACVKSERKEAMKEERQKQLDLCESLSRKVGEKCSFGDLLSFVGSTMEGEVFVAT